MRRSVILALSAVAASVCAVAASAQDSLPPVVTARFDRDSVMIGDQFHLDIEVDKDMMQVVEFPVLGGAEIRQGVEILGEYPVDTLAADSRRQTINKRYLVTVFDEGHYDMGNMPVLYLGKNTVDTLLSEQPLQIVVSTFQIDLEKDKPFDIKPPWGVRLRFGEIGGWFALCLGALAVLIAAVWLLSKYRHRIPLLGGERPQDPPHVEAIRRLEALRYQKLPQNGKHKLYYSGLTDILREYMDRRFGIGAMEMTSGEILAALDVPRRDGSVDDRRYGDLADLLHAADMVKFAKMVPSDDETESAYYNAYYFVEETKAVAVEGRAEETEDDIYD